MTATVTPAAMQARYNDRLLVSLTDIGTPRTGGVVVAVLQAACDRADAEVSAHVAGRYALPLASVPLVLATAAQDVALLALYQADPPAWVTEAARVARQQLRDIRDGRLELGLDEAGQPAAAAVVEQLAEFNGGTKHFPRGGAW